MNVLKRAKEIAVKVLIKFGHERQDVRGLSATDNTKPSSAVVICKIIDAFHAAGLLRSDEPRSMSKASMSAVVLERFRLEEDLNTGALSTRIYEGRHEDNYTARCVLLAIDALLGYMPVCGSSDETARLHDMVRVQNECIFIIESSCGNDKWCNKKDAVEKIRGCGPRLPLSEASAAEKDKEIVELKRSVVERGLTIEEQRSLIKHREAQLEGTYAGYLSRYRNEMGELRGEIKRLKAERSTALPTAEELREVAAKWVDVNESHIAPMLDSRRLSKNLRDSENGSSVNVSIIHVIVDYLHDNYGGLVVWRVLTDEEIKKYWLDMYCCDVVKLARWAITASTVTESEQLKEMTQKAERRLKHINRQDEDSQRRNNRIAELEFQVWQYNKPAKEQEIKPGFYEWVGFLLNNDNQTPLVYIDSCGKHVSYKLDKTTDTSFTSFYWIGIHRDVEWKRVSDARGGEIIAAINNDTYRKE